MEIKPTILFLSSSFFYCSVSVSKAVSHPWCFLYANTYLWQRSGLLLERINVSNILDSEGIGSFLVYNLIFPLC